MTAEECPAWRRACDVVELFAVFHLFGFYILFYSGRHRLFEENNLMGWGASWEPFFFMLSGFKLTYANSTGEGTDPEPLLPFMWQRLLKVYPLYLLSITLKVLQKLALPSAHPSQKPSYSPPWLQLPQSLLLWRMRWNEPSWMLRCLLTHWLLWRLAYRRLSSLSGLQCWCGLATCALFVFLRIELWRLGKLQWLEHSLLSLMTLPLFLAGALLGRLTQLRCGRPVLVLALGRGRRLGLGGLAAFALLLLTWQLCPSSQKRVPFKYGLLLPFHALLLLSLASSTDLLASLLRWRPLVRAARWRFACAMLMDPACTLLMWLGVQHWERRRLLCLLPALQGTYLALGALATQFLALRPAGGLPASQERDVPARRHMPLDAFAAVELFAVLHTFGFHMIYYSLQLQFYFEQNFLAWGGCWDPFFLLLSGFKLTCTQLSREDPLKAEPLFPFMLRRLKRVYPLYLFSLLLKCLQKIVYENTHPTQVPELNRFCDWADLPQNLLLWQSRWNGPSWFIRNILVHSLLWNLLCPRLMRLSLGGCWAGLACTMLFTYGRILVWKLAKPQLDLHLTHHSLVNFHMLLCGVFLARLSMAARLRRSRLSERLGGISVLGLLLGTLALSSAASERVPVKVGLLLPFHALLVHCLSRPEDFLGRLCRWPLLRRLGACAYALAILQDATITMLMRHWVGQWRSFDLASFCFLIVPGYVTLGTACNYFVQPIMCMSLERLGRRSLGAWLWLTGEK